MRAINTLRGAVVALALTGSATVARTAPPAAADLIFTNARVYTVEDAQPWAQSVAIRGGKIVAVGSDAQVAARRGAKTKIVDLGGRMLMPSFGDAHIHPIFGGLSYSRCALQKGKTVKDYQAIIAGCVAKTPGQSVIYGVGWEDGLFPPDGVPRKDILDAVSKDRPLIFMSVGGHSLWVNSKTLELAGITKATPDPANGKIDRDPATGEPIGGLQESAMDLVAKYIPTPGPAEMQESILYVTHLFNAWGITDWHDAGVVMTAGGTSPTLDAYKAVFDRGQLTSHVSIALKWANERSLEQIPELLAASKRVGAWGLHARAIKFYVDGVIPQKTAFMIAPYENSGTERGAPHIAPDILDKAVAAFDAQGMQSHFHAIGDGAVREALDAIAAARQQDGARDNRPMISHMNVIDPVDQKRFGPLGVAAVFQPSWASNYPYMDLTKQAIGPIRSGYIYPAKGVLSGGGMLAYGSDWPVDSANPLLGLEIAVTRRTAGDPNAEPLLPEQGVTLAQAVKAYTINVAYVNRFDKITGSIAVGKSADMIVLDHNIFDIPVQEVGKTKVLLTLFQGRPVFGTLEALGK